MLRSSLKRLRLFVPIVFAVWCAVSWFLSGPPSVEAGQASFPDLVVSSVTNPPSSSFTGGGFSVTDTTGNSGSATANPSTTRYRLSLDTTITSTDPLLTGSRSVPTLKKGSSSSGSITVTIPSNLTPGTYYLAACADDLAVITESNETNNCKVSTTTVTVTLGATLSATPSEVIVGSSVTASWSQIPNPTNTDWIGLYTVGSANTSYLTWMYVSCSTTPSVPLAAGSCPFGIPGYLTAGNYELRLLANNSYSTLATSNTIVVSLPPPPTKLAITSINSGANPTAGTSFSVTVQAQSAGGSPGTVSTATGVSLSLKTGTGNLTGTLNGTIAANTSQVTINGVIYSKAESGVVLTAARTSGDSLASGDSAPFTVNPGAANNLFFVTQPANSSASGAIVGPPTVAVRDVNGNTVTSSTASITVSLNGPPYAVLNGTNSKNASGGLAVFGDLVINQIENGYTLTASSSGLTNVTSSAFNISAPTGTIAGTVSRADNAAPINGATIEAFQAGVSMGTATSASNGSYSLSGLPTGIYELSATAPGYTGQPKSSISVTLGSTSTADFSLTPEKVVYVYDTLSRLRGVIDVAGQTATYSFDALGNLLGISRYSSSQTSVIDFTPIKGPAGTTTVTIYGTGFSLTPSQNTVTFNGTTATVISSAATQLVVTVPASATTGAIGVSAPSGSASSTEPFTVTASSGVPTITNFTPTIGSAGTAVAVSGANFDSTPSKNDLRFNNARGAISSSTATSLDTTVPSGAGSGRISVTTVLGKGTSSADFFVVPSGLTTTDIEFTGRLSTNGTPLTVIINNANKKGLIVFDGVAGQRMSLRVTNDTFPLACPSCSDVGLQFIRPDGQNWVSTGWANANAHYYEPPPLPASGTYSILFAPSVFLGASATGQATLELFNITGEDWGTINFASPVSVSVPIPGQNPQLSFTGTAGQRISLNVTNANFPMPCPWCNDAYVFIYKPDGQVLASGTWANGTGTFVDLQTLPVSGLYRIVLDPQWGSTGHATLTLYNVPPDDQGTIGPGVPVNANVTIPGHNPQWSFTGTAGQRISLNVTNANIPMPCPWCNAAYVHIYKPDGQLLTQGTWANGTGTFVDLQTLPTSGLYKVMLNPQGASTGQATLTLYNLPAEDQGPIAFGTPVTGITTLPGQNVSYTFNGTAGQQVSLAVSNTTFPLSCPWCWAASVQIIKPDNTTLVLRGWDIPTFIFVDTVTLPDAGVYKVLLDPAGTGTGQAQLTLYNVPSENQGSIAVDGPAANISMAVPGQNAKLTFAGTLNDMVMARVTSNTVSSATTTLLRQDGTTALASITTGQSNFNLSPVVLPASETFSVKVDPAGAATGNANVSVCRIPIASPPTLPGTDTVWVEDAIPAGASPTGTWNWNTIQKASGTQSHWDPPANGTHQHYFQNATTGLTINTGDTLFAYVLIDPCAPPQEIMLQWNENGSWEHRAYWGADLIGWGTSGTASRFPMGALPATGQWVRLEVPASSVGLEGKVVKGMAFTLYDGHAWFDRAGKFP